MSADLRPYPAGRWWSRRRLREYVDSLRDSVAIERQTLRKVVDDYEAYIASLEGALERAYDRIDALCKPPING